MQSVASKTSLTHHEDVHFLQMEMFTTGQPGTKQ